MTGKWLALSHSSAAAVEHSRERSHLSNALPLALLGDARTTRVLDNTARRSLAISHVASTACLLLLDQARCLAPPTSLAKKHQKQLSENSAKASLKAISIGCAVGGST